MTDCPISSLFRGMRPERVVAAALLALLCLAAPAAAQLDTPGHLLSAVQPARVTQVNATQGMLNNSRIWRGDAAADVVSTLRGYDATFTATTRIQAYTWDWYRNAPRTDVTPMVFLVITLEEWQTYCGEVPAEVGEGDVWLRRWLSQCAPEYQRTNTLACYDVGDPDVYDCHQYQGGMERQFEASHINYLTVTRAVGDEIAAALMERRSNAMELNELFTQPELIKALATLAAVAILAALTAAAGYLGIERGRRVWLLLRGRLDDVIELFDEVDDPAVVKVDNLLDKLVAGQWDKWIPVFVPVFVQALADGLNKTFGVPSDPEVVPEKPVDAA